MSAAEKTWDCIVCGSCTVDVVVRPCSLEDPVGKSRVVPVDPIVAAVGGIVSNSGTALARLGAKTAALSCVGKDPWADFVRRTYHEAGIDASCLATIDDLPTSTTVVLVDPSGERSFLHSQGAPKRIDPQFFLDRLDLFAKSRFMLLGYYAFLPRVEADLPEIFRRIRETGCRTALDAAGEGGTMQPLDRILPHCDVYVPSLKEAANQTGRTDPAEILAVYRDHGAAGLLGIKLGAKGAVLSPSAGELLFIPAAPPPGPVIDTTGAGDAFFAGLLVGLLRGMPLADAGRLAAAAGASCVTAMGGSNGVRDFAATWAMGRQ